MQLGCDANHLSPPSAEVKNKLSYNSTPSYVFTACTETIQPVPLPLGLLVYHYQHVITITETQVDVEQTAFAPN
jgi:hypothetical protein